jgi:hypothetical protein
VAADLVAGGGGEEMTHELSGTLMIAASEARHAIKNMSGDVVEKLKAAMKATRNHWMATNEDEQFKAAVIAVMLHYGEGTDEYNRLKWELENLKRFSAALSAAQAGISVDFTSVVQEEEKANKPIGLLKLWKTP